MTVTDALRPLTEAPERSAIFLDVDGTLAPIVERAEDATVPDETRDLLEELAARYALVACVSGRAAEDARRLVGLPHLTYAGGHGAELLRPGEEHATVLPAFAEWADRVHEFARDHDVGARMEDKGPIVAYHFRGRDDLEPRLREVARDAERQGFITHWGRKVLEIRPGVPVSKRQAVEELRKGLHAVLYAGDDVTDLDAFAVADVTVGVASDEGPDEILKADVVVDGPEEFVEVLRALR